MGEGNAPVRRDEITNQAEILRKKWYLNFLLHWRKKVHLGGVGRKVQ